MMILHLIKKEVLLVKKYIWIMMLLAIAVPVFVAWRVPFMAGFISFIYTVVFTELIICQSVSVEEAKFPKAAALLCATPYPRSTFVMAKYAFSLLIYVYCYVAYTLVALIVPGVDMIDLSMALAALLAILVLYGTYLPLYFKFGFERVKFFFMIFIFLISFGIPAYYVYFSRISFELSIFTSLSTTIQNIILAFVSFIILDISITISVKIYSKKEL